MSTPTPRSIPPIALVKHFALIALPAVLLATPAEAQPAPAPAGPGGQTAPAQRPAPAAETEDPIQIKFLYGLVIVDNQDDVKIEGVERFPGLVKPKHPLLQTEEFEELVTPYFQKPVSSATIRQMQRDIILFFRRHDRPLVDVLFIADANFDNGMLQLVVIEGKLGQLRVQDVQGGAHTNRWTDEAWIKSRIRVQPGEPIRQSQLMADLDALNRNPFRKVTPAFSPGGQFALSDILLRVEDRRPLEFTVGYENTGNEVTGENRLVAGVAWGKAFGLHDHQFTYEFSATPDFQGVRAHVASYQMPLPWRHNLRVFGSYVDVSGEVDQNTDLEGLSYQSSLRYEIPLPTWASIQNDVSGGLDFKHNDNDLLFGGSGSVNSPNEVFQLTLAYNAVRPDRFGQTALIGQFYFSPGNVTSLNDDESFEVAQQGASATYLYGNVTAERETHLFRLTDRARVSADNYLRWRVKAAAQWADGNLVPSEQYGVGGHATVRGYEEREANGAKGYYFVNELRSPAFSAASLFGVGTNGVDRCEFLAFVDTGMTTNVDLQDGEDPHVILTSVGPGLRYTFGRNFALRFDYGFPLVDSGVKRRSNGSVEPNEPRFHLGVSLHF